MIDPASLAALLGAYPEKPHAFVHDLAQHQLNTLPALTIVVASLGASTDTTASSPASQLQSLPSGGSAMLVDAPERDASYGELVAELQRLLRSVLIGTGDAPQFTDSRLIVLPAGTEVSAPDRAQHSAIFCVRGTSHVEITADAGASETPRSLGDGEALFIPAGRALAVRNAEGGSVCLELRWHGSEKLAQAEAKHGASSLFGRLLARLGAR